MAEVEKERRGAVQVLRINRPEARNSLNIGVLAGLGNGIAEADADPEIRSIVITATGDKAFCAGMDLRGFAEGTGGAQSDEDKAGLAGYQRFVREGVDTPVIGAANATAVAGGFELLLACDMVVASSAARFGLPEVKRSLFAAGGGVFLGGRIPLAVALELTLTGDYVAAERAFQLGLINRVVAPEQVLDEAVALADLISANGPLGVQATKRLVRAAAVLPADQVWALQAELQPEVFNSVDAKEGATAFIEKRAPVWQGR
ncbi:enoyl-CoA hydratase-related protein [Blastococcus sp. CT_GayMR16]|uniref:enoyl-CoA hydratase-related protein n=1 Tax=Blastococcus sp. CT_GayMR16 TaxID=2559607 RepID=UPI00107460C7|nr:enoyl-CoA hydratase-related protein [Blastococcus sp. CT_GayMR16]TFV88874.1 enoyl-CoA hydratase [Blastococcus sp. CT_GayMR16]